MTYAHRRHPSGLRSVALHGLIFVLCLPVTAAMTSAQQAPALPDNPLRGRLLFESRQCHHCHGLAGIETRNGPSLGEGRFGGSLLDLGAAMWNHVPGMSVRFAGSELPWPQLSESEVVELAAFLYAIEYLGRPGDAADGKRLFASHGCGGCHTIGARGGGAGPDLADLKGFASPLFVAQAIWNHGPSMLARMRAMSVPTPVFREGDLADLAAFIRQRAGASGRQGELISPGNPNRGRELLAAKGCTACHTARGRGGNAAPDLAAADLHRSADAIAGAMWSHVKLGGAMHEMGIAWPQLAPQEFADLVAYLYFLPFADPGGSPRRGAEVFVSRSCSDCHLSSGDRSHPGPDLAASRAAASAASLVAAMWNHAPVMREAIVEGGRPWPELTGQELRDLLAYLTGLATK